MAASANVIGALANIVFKSDTTEPYSDADVEAVYISFETLADGSDRLPSGRLDDTVFFYCESPAELAAMYRNPTEGWYLVSVDQWDYSGEYVTIDLGSACVSCGHSTAFGAGLFVNRIPTSASGDSLDFSPFHGGADDAVEFVGHFCAGCGGFECDFCDLPIPVDEDVAIASIGGEFHYVTDDQLDVDHHRACIACAELKTGKPLEGN